MMRLALGLCLILSACIDVPELDRAVPDWVEAAPYPPLVSLDGLQSGQPLPQDEATAAQDALQARADRLKRRAAALNTPVVDDETRSRMADGVSQ